MNTVYQISYCVVLVLALIIGLCSLRHDTKITPEAGIVAGVIIIVLGIFAPVVWL